MSDEPKVPVTQETIAGALIDSARISVMAAASLLPEGETPLIVLQGDVDDAPPSVQECLEQAANWLDSARALTIAAGAPVTSLHVVGGGR